MQQGSMKARKRNETHGQCQHAAEDEGERRNEDCNHSRYIHTCESWHALTACASLTHFALRKRGHSQELRTDGHAFQDAEGEKSTAVCVEC